MMKTVNLQQGSSEWLKWRKTRVTATDVAAILGVSPWKTAFQVYLEKIGMAPDKVPNQDMLRGKVLEPEARVAVNKLTGLDFEPLCIESPKYPWLAASLDGYHSSEQGKIICEIKCPRIRESLIMIPESYMYQMQTQMLLSGADSCLFVSYERGKEPIVQAVVFMKELADRIVEDTSKFWYNNVLAFEAPEMSSRDYYERTDQHFAELAQKWKWMQSRRRALDSEEKELKQQILFACGDQSCRGFGISVSQVPRKGTIEYQAIPAIKNMSTEDLNSYRKETKIVSTIREMKNG